METPKLDKAIDVYLSPMGEGDTLATQCVTAINKLVYKWYNDGDVFDNVHCGLKGWENDLSSYANWLFNHDLGAEILYQIHGIDTDVAYEKLLELLCDSVLDEDNLVKMNQLPADGTIYKCSGPFGYERDPSLDESFYYM